jgi:putative tryptophan/tyrosine transport system substrate-binding protein
VGGQGIRGARAQPDRGRGRGGSELARRCARGSHDPRSPPAAPGIAEAALRHRLPFATTSAARNFDEAGFLFGYGADPVENLRSAATFVDKILRGARPGDLPVEQPTRFQLMLNLRTAKALGLTIPPSVLARADEVIE